jgi:hypothetical protein
LYIQLKNHEVVESFNDPEIIKEQIEKQLSMRLEEGFVLKEISISNSSRKILRLPLKDHSFSITDFLLDIQGDLKRYGLDVHGRTSLPEFAWRIHILYKKQIIQTLEIEVVD